MPKLFDCQKLFRKATLRPICTGCLGHVHELCKPQDRRIHIGLRHSDDVTIWQCVKRRQCDVTVKINAGLRYVAVKQ